MLKIKNVKCCGLVNPLGLNERIPYYSWQLESNHHDVYQAYYRIEVIEKSMQKEVWNSQWIQSSEQLRIEYEGKELSSNKEYEYTVFVKDNHGEVSESHNIFSLGLMENEWEAKWIGIQDADLLQNENQVQIEEIANKMVLMMEGKDIDIQPDRKLEPCYMYRKQFKCSKSVKKAFINITAHGLYQAKINGKDITEERFNPGFTVYDQYLEYQTYDVTQLLQKYENTLTIILADGWYKGKLGIFGFGENYGSELALLLQVDIEYGDGTHELIVSDDSFKYHQTNILYSDIMIGEKQDGRIDVNAFYQSSYVDDTWKNAVIKNNDYEQLQGVASEPVRVIKVIDSKEKIVTPKGETVIDMGQNMVGVVRLSIHGHYKQEIKLEHSEVLDKEGNFINNITGLNRDQTDYYITNDQNMQIFEPKFTFHGFRYVKITGYDDVSLDDVKGIVIASDLQTSGEFECSNPLLNQLQSNIYWSQLGNMLSIPTDCPQREKSGWTGDVFVFEKTATFNQNVHQFFKKWLVNMEKEQFDNGLIPVVIPYPKGYSAVQETIFHAHTSAGWGDVVISLPWHLYETYGDISILQDHFEMMKKWLDYIESRTSMNPEKYLWNQDFHFGDWGYPSCKNEMGQTDMMRSAQNTKEYVGTIMYAHSTELMGKVCHVLNKEDLAKQYKELTINIKQAFDKKYIDDLGKFDCDLQGVYILAIAMKMADEEKLALMAKNLVDLIIHNDYRLDTGFLSVKFLMDVLVQYGYSDIAKKILYQEQCPSWLYEVKKGATTIWETWDAILENDTRSYQSYNHYAFGCIGDWMYRELGGIKLVEKGYRKFKIELSFDYDLTSCHTQYESVFGTILCDWSIKNHKGLLIVQVPVGTECEVFLPNIDKVIGSGTYEFEWTI